MTHDGTLLNADVPIAAFVAARTRLADALNDDASPAAPWPIVHIAAPEQLRMRNARDEEGDPKGR